MICIFLKNEIRFVRTNVSRALIVINNYDTIEKNKNIDYSILSIHLFEIKIK